MIEFGWAEQVGALSRLLDDTEARVHRGETGTADLEKFKSALDDLRLRTWGLLSAATAEDPHGFQERFRTHRGTEMCRALSNDLRTGRLSGSQPDLPDLASAAKDLASAVKETAPKGTGRRKKS